MMLARLAAGARVPVFCLIGDGGRQRARALRLEERIRLTDSPRHATVLLVVGRLPRELFEAARRVHDQLPAPRATLVWSNDEATLAVFEHAERLSAGADHAADRVVALHRALMRGEQVSAPSLGPAENPVKWRGVGPHGQGGEGMMGGKPYGRPLAMTGDDVRDGLSLDCMRLGLGPFLPWMPPGMQLEAVLQGDVLQALTAKLARFEEPDLPGVFVRAMTEPVRVDELELARARHHLAATADLLLLLGLDALAERVLRVARALSAQDAERVRRLERLLYTSGALRLATHGTGTLDAERVTGPAARASGSDEDARRDDPAYVDLDFSPVTLEAGDAEARWRQRLAEAAHALELARRTVARVREPGPALEGPRGVVGEPGGCLDALVASAPGQAWDAFVTTLVSLDLDVASLCSGDAKCPR